MMTLMRDLSPVAPSSEALIRIYAGVIALNNEAARVLGLTDDSRIAFKVGNEPHRVYIGKRQYSAYSLSKRGRGYRVNSADLSRKLAEALDGCGTYRIERETSVSDYSGNKYFMIFKKYGAAAE